MVVKWWSFRVLGLVVEERLSFLHSITPEL
jgi:hypothetical protein